MGIFIYLVLTKMSLHTNQAHILCVECVLEKESERHQYML